MQINGGLMHQALEPTLNESSVPMPRRCSLTTRTANAYVSRTLNIPVFDLDAVEQLLDWRA